MWQKVLAEDAPSKWPPNDPIVALTQASSVLPGGAGILGAAFHAPISESSVRTS